MAASNLSSRSGPQRRPFGEGTACKQKNSALPKVSSSFVLAKEGPDHSIQRGNNVYLLRCCRCQSHKDSGTKLELKAKKSENLVSSFLRSEGWNRAFSPAFNDDKIIWPVEPLWRKSPWLVTHHCRGSIFLRRNHSRSGNHRCH